MTIILTWEIDEIDFKKAIKAVTTLLTENPTGTKLIDVFNGDYISDLKDYENEIHN